MTEKTLKDLGDKVPVNDRGQIEQVMEELRGVKDGQDLTQIRTLTERLQQASHALTQQMYQQPGAADGANYGPTDGNAGNPGGADDDVVEGEYRSV